MNAGEHQAPGADAVLRGRLKAHVEILAGMIGPRHLRRPSSMEAAASYIERELGDVAGEGVTRQTYQAETETSNLLLERRGDRRRDQIVVIGAHYDSCAGTPGADDNASAVVMLIEVARLTAGTSAARTVRFVAFTCEEPPHFSTGTMGSQYYARTCCVRGEQIVAMLCLEMVGYYSSAPGSQGLPPAIPRFLRWAFPSRGNFLAVVGNLRSIPLLWPFRRGFKSSSSLPLYSISLPEWIREIRLSDNSSFWDQGYRALMVTDTSFLRNPNYHRATDTPGTLDYTRLAQATRGVAGALSRLTMARGRSWRRG